MRPNPIRESALFEAAGQRAALGMQVNIAAVARHAGVPRCTLSDYLEDRPELRRRLRVVVCKGGAWRTTEFYRDYEIAANKIKLKGGWPSTVSLARTLKFRQKRVSKYLAQHPMLVQRIGYIPGHLGICADKIARAAYALRKKGLPVTKRALAAEADICYQSLWSTLKKLPDFTKELRISRAAYGTAGWPNFKKKRRTERTRH